MISKRCTIIPEHEKTSQAGNKFTVREHIRCFDIEDVVRAGGLTLDEAFEKVRKIAKENPDGFTYDLKESKLQRSGIVAAYLETQDQTSDEGLRVAVAHALKNDGIVGGWFNSDADLFQFDSVKSFPSGSVRESVIFAFENQQQSIANLDSINKEDWVNAFIELLPEADFNDKKKRKDFFGNRDNLTEILKGL